MVMRNRRSMRPAGVNGSAERRMEQLSHESILGWCKAFELEWDHAGPEVGRVGPPEFGPDLVRSNIAPSERAVTHLNHPTLFCNLLDAA